MKNSVFNKILSQCFFLLTVLNYPNCYGQPVDHTPDCITLAREFDKTYDIRVRLSKSRNYVVLDSLYSAQLAQFEKHCPCSKKCGEVTFTKANIKFYQNLRPAAFEIMKDRIKKCAGVNDTTTLYVLGRRALFSLRDNDFYNMKRDLDEAIEIGIQKFYPSYRDLYVARINLGLYYQWKRDYHTALKVHIQNEKNVENEEIFVDTSAHIDNLDHIISVALEMDDQNVSQIYFDKLSALVKGSRFEKRAMNSNYEALLDYYLKKGDLNKAEVYFNLVDTSAYNDFFKALPLIRFLYMTGQEKDALMRINHLRSILDRNEIPKYHFARVNVALERLKVEDINSDLVSYLSSSIHNNYVNLINDSPDEQHGNMQIVNDKYTALIHRLTERGKLDFLPIVYDRLHNIKNASSSYYPNLSRLLAKNTDLNFRKDYNAYLRLSKAQYEGILNDSIHYFSTKIQNRLRDLGINWHTNKNLAGIQEKLSENEVFLDFYQAGKINGEEMMYLFVVARDRMDFVHFKNITDTLLLQILSANYVNNSKKNKALYDYLIKPIQPYLASKQKLFISTDGLLNQVALEILSPSGNRNDLFGDRYELLYIENSKFFFETHAHKYSDYRYLLTGGIQYDCTEKQNMLALSIKTTKTDRAKYQYLEGSKREIEVLISKLKDQKITLKSFMECEATKDSILVYIGDSHTTHIHISTHGISETSNVQNVDKYFVTNSLSQLLLAKVKEQDDAGLSAIEIINQDHTNKKLVFLSACNTGIGTYMAGFGNASVANAFKKAGAKQVVATLWPIPDDVTVLLCDYFYDHYLTHQDANAALKFAQNELRKQNFPPEKWAAFRVMN